MSTEQSPDTRETSAISSEPEPQPRPQLITGHPYTVKFLAPNDAGHIMTFTSTLTRIIAELDSYGMWSVISLHFANGVIINDWPHAWHDFAIEPVRS